ncbi:cytochrome P450 [Marasmius fiardii PR-910]|nr:cytochrome P450 [Marasmius fiardii PR-910]
MEILKLLLFFSSSIFVLRLFKKRYHRGFHLPPGPKRIPILGNIFDMKAKRKEPIHITFTNWSQIYGDVFTFDVLGSRTIVLNSYRAIIDLLEHRSYNYSDRAHQPMLNEVVGTDWSFAFMRYSDSWRLHRRTFHQFFQPRVVTEYNDIQRKRTSSLVQKLMSTPKDFFKHARTHAGGIILEVVYGYHIQDVDDPYVHLADKAMEGFREAGISGSFLVDYIPLLKHIPAWFPGASFKSKAEVWARDVEQLKNDPWMVMKQSMVNGTAVPCFSTRSLEKFGISPSTLGDDSGMEKVIKNCATVAYGAGADTTVSAVLSFIIGMLLNPHAQARAQKELNDVVGSSRLPDFCDRDKLPYINAVYAETLRWTPVAPLGVAHAAVNDDVYEGNLIPGGSTVVANIWAILHDESLYGPDVMNFNPDRFMKEGKDLAPNPELIAFGFGRRICPGRYLAINSVWLAITYILANFTIAKEVDEDGKEIDPAIEYSHGLISHPLPFNCRFVPRSEALLLS